MSDENNLKYGSDGYVIRSSSYAGLHKLHVAVNNVTTMCSLLEEGVDVNVKTRLVGGQTALHIAVLRLCEVAEWISIGKVRKWVINPDVIKVLLEYKASVNATNEQGGQPLHYLIGGIYSNWLPYSCQPYMTRVLPILDTLLEQKADINHKDINGYTPLSLCCKYNDRSLVKEVLDRKANPRDEEAISEVDYMRPVSINDNPHILDILERRTKFIESEW